MNNFLDCSKYCLGYKVHRRRDRITHSSILGLPWWLSCKESSCNVGDLGSIPRLGRSPAEGKGYPLQYSDFHFLSSSWCFKILDMIPEFYLDCLLFPLSSCILLSTFLTYFFLILISVKPESVAIATEWEFLSTSEVALIISPSYGYECRLLE